MTSYLIYLFIFFSKNHGVLIYFFKEKIFTLNKRQSPSLLFTHILHVSERLTNNMKQMIQIEASTVKGIGLYFFLNI